MNNVVPTPPATVRLHDPNTLDAQALDRLRELDPDGRHGVVHRVLTAFELSLTRMNTVLDEQNKALVIDNDVVKSIAHTLKSSSASVGALALSVACADVEARVRDQPLVDLRTDIACLQRFSAAALDAVRAMLRT
jgi:HPt (histidine-containing phosphotransfer) domain-containing protein